MQPTSESTLAPSRSSRDAVSSEPRPRPTLPALTILCHPDASRVGERAVLGELESGARAEIARLRPDFSPPGSFVGRPLGDRYLSRRPLIIERRAESLRLEAAAASAVPRLNGLPIDGIRMVSPEDLDRGVVLELAERVVLLLHRHTPSIDCQPDIPELVGDSDAMVELRTEIGRVADQTVHVLIRGETGTGKELVASALHALGERAERPFEVVNLGALPPSLAVGELFGAARGAYTGATEARIGDFRRADGGTLFLDEIGEATPEVQVAMLRTLETGEVRSLGEARARKIDVRVVAATDADLEHLIEEGRFKEPLLHRLAGYELRMPPLRERRDDIGRLLVHFLARQEEELGEDRLARGRDSGEPWIDARLVGRLARFDWPGNVRQLRNVTRQLAIGNRGRRRIESVPAIERLLDGSPEAARSSGTTWAEESARERGSVAAGRSRKPADIDDREILDVLRAERFEIKAAAKELGISRAALYARIEHSPLVHTAGQLDEGTIRQAHQELGGDLDALVERLEVSRFSLRRRLRELGL